ncbi:MAG: hypothetical protein AAFO89_12045 [Planctomycetota bacterium]
MPIRLLVLSIALSTLLTAPLASCGHHARVTVTPTSPNTPTNARLAPSLTTRAYTYEDENTVHIYLSDLSPEALADPDTAIQAVGQIVHIHMFIRPNPGRTPIEPDALNASIRHAILAPNNATGIYAGGGFLLPKSRAASGTFKGTIAEGTLRLEAATPNFTDALGPASLRATFDIPNDDDLAAKLAARLAEAVKQTAMANR